MDEIRTVIFDLDGTLLNTLDDLATSVNYALTAYHLPLRSLSEVRSSLGNGIRALVGSSVPAGTSNELLEGVFQCFKSHYVKHCLDHTRPYPDLLDTLRQLQQRGIAMGIVSNKLQPAVTELNRRFFADFISVAIGESADIRRKPNPDAVLAALARLGGDKHSAVYVGDSEVDIATARNAGLPCISVLWGFRDEDFLRHRFPEACFIRHPSELLRIVDGGIPVDGLSLVY